jgi:YVTN family beta-propeller protein
VPVGYDPEHLCYNPLNNKVYCASTNGHSVTVIDGATDRVIATVATSRWPVALCYNPLDNRVYCISGSDSVTVIDGRTNQVVAAIPVGDYPTAICHGLAQNRVFVANNWSSSISVLRDSTVGVQETPNGEVRRTNAATVVRGVLFLPEARGEKREARSELLDISGRKVLDLSPGANDVSGISPGVYFIREQSVVSSQHSGSPNVRKVVLTE